MKNRDKRIPKKFQNSNKTFVERVFREQEDRHTPGFLAFPQKVSFYGKDSGEDIVLIVRRHWIAYIPDIFIILLVLLVPLILLILSTKLVFLGSPVLYIGMFVLSIGLGSTLALSTILKWYYTIHIVTDQRIVVVKMNNAFYHSYSEAQLEKIEDINHKHVGFLGTFFDVGNLDIDTAGHGVDFTLSMLPRPREMQDILNDLLEMKQKGVI